MTDVHQSAWDPVLPQELGCEWYKLNQSGRKCFKKPEQTIKIAYLGNGDPLPDEYKPITLCNQHLEELKTMNMFERE